MKESRRRKFERLRVNMELERSTFISHWKDIGDYILPRRPRWTSYDVNKGDKRNQKIQDGTQVMSSRTLRSGMMSGITSPARPWFELGTVGGQLDEWGQGQAWLHHVTEAMRTVLLRSNLYNVLPLVYEDVAGFGTACMVVEEDFDSVVHFTSIPVGSYCISVDHVGKVCGFSRVFMMTVRQICERFCLDRETGEYNFSSTSDFVKMEFDRGNLETWIEVCHQIQKNEMYDPEMAPMDAKYKRYVSVHYELGSGMKNKQISPDSDYDRFLSESGHDRIRILAPRWETNAEDSYGTNCPGMMTLPDIKQLQLMVKRGAQAVEKMINPPMVGPTHLRNTPVSIMPGDITYVDTREGQAGLRPAHEIRPDISALDAREEALRMRIKRGWFEDLFLMLAQSDRREITAREIEERHEEKMWALGPVLESLNQDLLDPLIEIVFEIMLKQGLLPPPPEEIAGAELNIQYVSVMARAQRLIGIGSVERFVQFAGGVAQFDQSILDKIDLDQAIDEYGQALGIPPGIVREDEMVAEIREQRAQAMEQQRQMAMLQQGAKAAKDASDAEVTPENALGQVLGGVEQ